MKQKLPSLRKRPHNKQELNVDAVKTWKSITREDTKHLLVSLSRRPQTFTDCKEFSTELNIMILFDYF